MSNLANGRVNLKFNNTVLAQKSFDSLYTYFILKLNIFYELNHRPIKLVRSAIKSKLTYNGWGKAFDEEGS